MSIQQLIMLLGYFTITIIVMKMLQFVWYIFRVYFLTKLGFRKNLKDYGEWAVVTGATDGIGKEYAKQLAQAGINIVLVSRTKEKLERIAEEIENVSGVKTKIIVFDYTKQNGYNTIQIELMNLDIGILVNNVGMSYGQRVQFDVCDIQHTTNIMNTNMLSDVRMTHIVLSGMVSRRKGVVVHVSSGSIYISAPHLNVYAATKIFMKKFVELLQIENRGVVEHQLVTPMYVESKMSKMKPTISIPTAAQYVRSAIRTIGVCDNTCGYLSHEFVYLLLYIMPICLAVKFREARLKKQ